MNARRSTALTVLAFFGAFAAGPATGFALARFLAPDSFIAEAVGTFAFPLAFVSGLQAWLGLALTLAVVQVLRRLRAGEPWRRGPLPPGTVPPGSFAFVPISIGMGVMAGVVVGLVSDSWSVLASAAAFALAGSLYGTTLWLLASAGYLPFPDHS